RAARRLIGRQSASDSNAPPIAGRFLLCSRENDIADRNITRRHHFGVYATVGVIEILEKRARDGQIAEAVVRIDIGRGTALDALDDLEPRIPADRQHLTEQIELMPRRPAGDIQVTAKAQRIYGYSGGIFHGGDGGQVDDRNDPLGYIGKTVAILSGKDLRRPAQFLRHEAPEKCLDG